MKIEIKFEFGQKVKDRISGFAGIVRAINIWDNGCVKIAAQGLMKDGKIPDCEWIDAQQLEILEDAKRKKVKPSGGPMPIEKAMRMPKS
uniref:Uncharacterized protein n=1 Tax=viral metagenome TaxID=1070528 RepID=A0A6M3LJL1_9ZZZZ